MAYIGKQPTVGNFVKLDAITTSATTTFNLTNGGVAYYPQSPNHCLVSLNGILQAPTDSFTISGSTIIFSSALTTSDVIDFIIVLGDVLNIGTPSDNTVSLAKLTATGTKDSTTFLRGDNTFQTIGKNTPIFALRKSSNQTTVANTGTLITWSNADIDTDSGFSDANDSWTVPTGKGGKYYLTLACGFDYGTRFIIYIYKNGSTILELDTNYPNNYSNPILNATTTLNAGDELKAYYYSVTSTGTLRYQNDAGNYVTRFEGFKLVE